MQLQYTLKLLRIHFRPLIYVTFLTDKIPIAKIKARIHNYNRQESFKNQQLQLSFPIPTESP
jgi:hypothetical protein